MVSNVQDNLRKVYFYSTGASLNWCNYTVRNLTTFSTDDCVYPRMQQVLSYA